MKNNNKLYRWLIITFIILYAATAFVSFYHSITFFNIANSVWLAVILSLVAEIGQASVLFSLLLTKNKHSTLAWSIMFLLTALQIVGNVVSSYKYISVANTIDFTYFQQSILFWVSDTNSNMFKIIIAWITGAILPIIALSMTALVADNMKLKEEEDTGEEFEETKEEQIDEEIELSTEGTSTDTNIVEEPLEKPRNVSKPRVTRQKKTKSNIKGKSIKLKPIKDLDSIKKVSRGTELIQNMQGEANANNKVTTNIKNTSDQMASDTPSSPPNALSITYDKNGNVIDRNY